MSISRFWKTIMILELFSLIVMIVILYFNLDNIIVKNIGFCFLGVSLILFVIARIIQMKCWDIWITTILSALYLILSFIL